MGYKRRFTFQGAEVLLGGTVEMGVHVVLGGTSLRYLAQPPVGLDLARLIGCVASGAVRCSRADLAIDSFDGSLTRERITAAWFAGEVTSRWDNWQAMVGGRRGRPGADGWTFYLGDKSSDARLRIYDKRAERLVKGGKEESLARRYPDGWVRVEFQLRNETATAALRVWHQQGGAALSRVLLGYIAFRVPSGSDRPERWPVADWWAAVIGAVATQPMQVERPDGDLAATQEWLETQAAPSLAAILLAAGGDLSAVHHVALTGAGRFSPKLTRRLQQAGFLAEQSSGRGPVPIVREENDASHNAAVTDGEGESS